MTRLHAFVSCVMLSVAYGYIASSLGAADDIAFLIGASAFGTLTTIVLGIIR